MTPEDVLIESIQAASIYGDSAELRQKQCEKLILSMLKCLPSLVESGPNLGANDQKDA